jgi:hypothetical protein
MLCPKCGAEIITGDSDFCPKCGSDLRNVPNTNASALKRPIDTAVKNQHSQIHKDASSAQHKAHRGINKRPSNTRLSVFVALLAFFIIALAVLVILLLPSSYEKGRDAYEKKDWAHAIAFLREVGNGTEEYDSAQVLLLQTASEAYDRKDSSTALRAIESIDERSPVHEAAQLLLLNIALDSFSGGNFDVSQSVLERVEPIGERYIVTYDLRNRLRYEFGIREFKKGNWRAAMHSWDKVDDSHSLRGACDSLIKLAYDRELRARFVGDWKNVFVLGSITQKTYLHLVADGNFTKLWETYGGAYGTTGARASESGNWQILPFQQHVIRLVVEHSPDRFAVGKVVLMEHDEKTKKLITYEDALYGTYERY